MRHWFTQPDSTLQSDTVKRFEPSHWIVDSPRGSMASVVSAPGQDELTVTATFAGASDLVGLIYESEDRQVHVGHRRDHNCDYSRCTLEFRWRSNGILPLDVVNGPTLTIEGEDEQGVKQVWYVRLWNYAEGTPEDALIRLPFDELLAGYNLEASAEPVRVKAIDRLFISLVAPGYDGVGGRFAAPKTGQVTFSDVRCTGSGSVIRINDTFVPEHGFRICTAYDDAYFFTPERLIDSIERLGFRKLINHYVGMSHYPALGGDGLVASGSGICEPTRRWHESFAALAKARGYSIIWSLSMELLDEFCPEQWKQRAWDGAPAATGYVPPSTLLSPAVDEAVDYLGDIASQFVAIGTAAGLPPMVQIGEPWWWVRADGAICMYDADAVQHWPSQHVPIKDVRNASSSDATTTLDLAGAVLADCTSRICAMVEDAVGPTVKHVLPYLPSILRADAPELKRANLPVGWSWPAFDCLQLEDYEWVMAGHLEQSRRGLAEAAKRLAYGPTQRHYLAGFAEAGGARQWRDILSAAERERSEQTSEVFVWALPQILRDALTIFEGDDDVQAFRDVAFPLTIGASAWVEPRFSTTIATGTTGYEFRNVNWEQSRLHFDVGPGVRSLDDLKSLLTFFRSMHGNACAFRFRDPLDFSSNAMTEQPTPTDVQIGLGDGQTRTYSLVKLYDGGERRRITRPVSGSIIIGVDGNLNTAWSLSDKGVIEFDAAPAAGAAITAGFLFDVPVRFEEERLRVSHRTFGAGDAPSVPLIEVREA